MIDWPLTIAALVAIGMGFPALCWADSVMWRHYGVSCTGVIGKKFVSVNLNKAEYHSSPHENISKNQPVKCGNSAYSAPRVRARAFGS